MLPEIAPTRIPTTFRTAPADSGGSPLSLWRADHHARSRALFELIHRMSDVFIANGNEVVVKIEIKSLTSSAEIGWVQSNLPYTGLERSRIGHNGRENQGF